jgi:membrane protease YdiL (CAAX protease family)
VTGRPGARPLRRRVRANALTNAALVFPLFLFYQVGILMGARGHNGVDFITRLLVDLCDRDLVTYLQLLLALVVGYAIVLSRLRRSGTFDAGEFAPVLLEASIYALAMGSVIVFAIQGFLGFFPALALAAGDLAEIFVISAGAGFNEELVFRLVLFAGLARVLAPVLGAGTAWIAALIVSSVLFSLAHHVGSGAEAFSWDAFTYRALAGVYFAAIYYFRGLGVAAWTHALYDVFVLSLRE